jgi:hypothetical protein
MVQIWTLADSELPLASPGKRGARCHVPSRLASVQPPGIAVH